MNNNKDSLYVVPNIYFKQGLVSCSDYKKFNNNGLFINDKPSIALNIIKTCAVIKHNNQYICHNNNRKKNLCSVRYVTLKDKSIDTITNAINNHIQDLSLAKNQYTKIGYVYNLLKYKNIVYFVFVINTDNLNLSYQYCKFNMKQLIDNYFSFNILSRNIIDFLYGR